MNPVLNSGRTLRIVEVLFLLASATALCSNAAAATKALSDPLIERGKQVATAADCVSCHSQAKGKLFAGGDALKTPFGNLYAPNITPDLKTGIGGWTKADFTRALRQGVRKDGALLYPAMPYTNYTQITDPDMDALWAYMQSIPAVQKTSPANTLPFPLNVRQGLAVWQDLYFEPGPFVANPAKDAVWNRGAYLVEALAHCDACHTPRNIAQGPETQHALSGAQIEGWYAPDIGSNDPQSSTAKWNVDQLATFLRTGVGAGNVTVFGPMAEVVHQSLSKLPASDVQAMAVYLKDLPDGSKPLKPVSASVPAEQLAAGKGVYEMQCSSCHQSDGKGVAGSVPALAGNAAVVAREPFNVILSMLDGFKPRGTWGVMPSFATVLSDDDIANVSNYVRTAWGNNGQPNATAWSVHNWRPAAEAPSKAQQEAVICPNLPKDVLQPALSEDRSTLLTAAADPASMTKVVGDYRGARPKSSRAQVVEALSSAYCRAIIAGGDSRARTDSRIAEFAQQVALVLARREPAAATATPVSRTSQ